MSARLTFVRVKALAMLRDVIQMRRRPRGTSTLIAKVQVVLAVDL